MGSIPKMSLLSFMTAWKEEDYQLWATCGWTHMQLCEYAVSQHATLQCQQLQERIMARANLVAAISLIKMC